MSERSVSEASFPNDGGRLAISLCCSARLLSDASLATSSLTVLIELWYTPRRTSDERAQSAAGTSVSWL